jgi:DNA-binding response OmpR family regulator
VRAGALDILLVEDNESLSENIAEYLEARGHRVDFAYDGRSGLETALAGSFDIVILDLSLPRLDGVEVCRKIRSKAPRHMPIIMLTARDALRDKLQGFEAGADDYLTKPFELAELVARCEALSQRHRVGTSHVLKIGPLTIDRRTSAASREGRPLRLTPITFKILLFVAEAHPAPVTRHDLTRRLWGEDPPESDSLRSHVHLLRQALDKRYERPMLETVHGVGFRLRADP